MSVLLFYLQLNDKGETPLHKACIDGNFKRVKVLIDQVSICTLFRYIMKVVLLLCPVKHKNKFYIFVHTLTILCLRCFMLILGSPNKRARLRWLDTAS